MHNELKYRLEIARYQQTHLAAIKLSQERFITPDWSRAMNFWEEHLISGARESIALLGEKGAKDAEYKRFLDSLRHEINSEEASRLLEMGFSKPL